MRATANAARAVRAAAQAAGLGQRTDQELLAALVDGKDAVAFEAILRRHGPVVLAACRHLLRDEADVEDAFQATFVALYQNAGSIRGGPALAGWLFRVARRAASRVRRAAGRWDRLHRRVARAEPAAAGPDPSWREACAVLHAELDRLPDALRLPLIHCYLGGLSRDEAAQRLGWSVDTVRGRLERGRARLRARLQRRGLTLSAGLLAAVGSAGGVPPALVRAAARSASAGAPPAVAGIVRAVLAPAVGSRTLFAAAAAVALAVGVGGSGLLGLAGAQPTGKAPPPDKGVKPAADARGVEPADLDDVHGRVVGPDGRPVPKARVFCTTGPHLLPDFRPPDPVTADADGRFRFRLPAPARPGDANDRRASRVLTAVAPGWGFGWAAVPGPGAADGVTIRLAADDVPITGRVVDLEGKPLAGVSVRVLRVWVSDAESVKAWAEAIAERKEFWNEHLPRTSLAPRQVGLGTPQATDRDGRFTLRGVGRERLVQLRFEGPAVARAEAYAMTRAAKTVQFPASRTTPEAGNVVVHGAAFDHAAGPTQPVVGTVRDTDTGKPIAGVVVRTFPRYAHADSDDDGVYLQTVTDADGRYRLTGLARAADRRIECLPGPELGFVGAMREAPAGPGSDPVGLDFGLKTGVPVRGRVTDKGTGQPVAGATVEYFAFADNPHRRGAPGLLQAPTAVTTGADGSYALVALPGRGLVTAKVDGRGRGRYLIGVGARAVKGRDPERNSFTTFPYIVTAGLFNTLRDVDLAAGAQEAACDLALDPGKTVRGRVLDPDGKPVSGVDVDGVWGEELHVRALPTAEFVLPGVDPDEPKARFFYHRERKLGAAVLPTGGEPAGYAVRLERCGAITGRLLDEDGQPMAKAHVAVAVEGGQLGLPHGWSGFLGATTDAAGRFRVELVIPGVEVSADLQRGNGLVGRVFGKTKVKAGETRDLGDIRFRGRGG